MNIVQFPWEFIWKTTKRKTLSFAFRIRLELVMVALYRAFMPALSDPICSDFRLTFETCKNTHVQLVNCDNTRGSTHTCHVDRLVNRQRAEHHTPAHSNISLVTIFVCCVGIWIRISKGWMLHLGIGGYAYLSAHVMLYAGWVAGSLSPWIPKWANKHQKPPPTH